MSDHGYLKEVVGWVNKTPRHASQPREVIEAIRSAAEVGRLPHRQQNNLDQKQRGNDRPRGAQGGAFEAFPGQPKGNFVEWDPKRSR